MQLQVDISRQTCLIIQKSVKKVVFFSVFWRFSTTPEFWPYDVTHYKKYIYFWLGWTQNRPRIPKMYNIMGIWPIDQELLSCKPIATLRWWNEKRQSGRRKDIWFYQIFKNEKNEKWKKTRKRRDAQEVMISWLADWLAVVWQND